MWKFVPFLCEFKFQQILEPDAAQCCGVLENSLIFTVNDNT